MFKMPCFNCKKKKLRNDQSYAVGTNNLKQSSFLQHIFNPPFFPPMIYSYAKGGEINDNATPKHSLEFVRNLDQSYYYKI
jgi:hypothetical protein